MMRINQGVSNVALAPADLAPAWPAENRPLVWHGMAPPASRLLPPATWRQHRRRPHHHHLLVNKQHKRRRLLRLVLVHRRDIAVVISSIVLRISCRLLERTIIWNLKIEWWRWHRDFET